MVGERKSHRQFVQAIWRGGKASTYEFELRFDSVAGLGAIARARCKGWEPTWLSATRHPGTIPVIYVFYPSWHDAQVFAESAKTMLGGGMSESFPASVGVMHARVKHLESGEREIVIESLQGSFRRGKPREMTHHAIAPYSDFAHHLIEHLFNKRVDEKVGKVTLETAFGDRRGQRVVYGKNNAKIFRGIAEKKGFNVRELKSGLVLVAERKK